MKRIVYSLAMVAACAGNLWAQDPPGGAPPEAPASSVGDADALPAQPGAPQETLEQRVSRLEAELAEARSGAVQVEQGSSAAVPGPAVVDNSWRYRQHRGAWWYWLPSNRWVYWSNGAWVDYVPGTPVVVTAPSYGISPRYGTGYPYTTRYHSHYRPSIGVHIGGYGYGYGHGHSIGHGHGHSIHGGHGHGHGGHGHGHGGHGHGGHGGGHGH